MKKTIAGLLLVTLVLAVFSFAFAVTTQPVQAQTAAQAQVLSYSWYIAPNGTTTAVYPGDLVCVGEIQNIVSSTFGSIDVVGMAVNENGDILAQSSTTVYGNNLAPNQKAPFYIDFTPQTSITYDQTWAEAVSDINLYVTTPTSPTDTPYTGLSISGTSGTSTVTGTLQNTGSQAVGNVWVVATYYNSAGDVIAVGYSNYLNSGTQRFDPGQSASFSVSPLDAGAFDGTIASNAVIYQYMSVEDSKTPTPVPSTPTPTQQPTHTANPTTTPHSSNQEPTEPFAFSSTTLLIAIVAALLVLVVIMVIAIIIFLRRKTASAAPAQAPPVQPQP